MTRDEILAAIDAQQALLDQAVTDIETATAAKVAAEVAIADGEARRGAAQLELARLVEALANVPPDPPRWDPLAVVHAWEDCLGCRNTVPAAVWEARTGYRKRTGATYANWGPFERGDWPNLTPEVIAGEARLLIGVTPEIHPDLRGKHDETPAKLAAWEAACLAEIKAWGDGRRDAKIRRAITSAVAEYGDRIRQTIQRIGWEFDGAWFPWSICPSDAHADAWAAMCNRIMAIFAEVSPHPLTLAFNLAGTPQCPEARIQRALGALRIPVGCSGLLTLDDYCATLSDVLNLRANLARLDRFVAANEWVVGVGFDEIGPHNDTKATDALLDRLGPVKAQWITELVAHARSYATGRRFGDRVVGLSHVTPFETIYPGGRPASCVMVGDRTDVIKGATKTLVLPGRASASFVAHNGERVPSNDPEMAEALLAALWED